MYISFISLIILIAFLILSLKIHKNVVVQTKQ